MLPQDKLIRGIELTEQAGEDSDLLGVALLVFQSILDAQLRDQMATHPELAEQDRLAIASPETSLSKLVEIAQHYGDLTRDQRWRILDAENLRQGFIQGESFRGSLQSVRSYGRFVAELSGNEALFDEQAAAFPAAEELYWAEREERYRRESGLFGAPWLTGLFIVVVLGLAVWAGALFLRPMFEAAVATPTPNSRNLPLEPVILATQATQAATALPPASSESTPAQTRSVPAPNAGAGAIRQARIVRLGGGPGWLHETADFSSPTLPIRLSEGQEVSVLGPEQLDSSGTPWIYVSVGGYEGWSPTNNIEYIN